MAVDLPKPRSRFQKPRPCKGLLRPSLVSVASKAGRNLVIAVAGAPKKLGAGSAPGGEEAGPLPGGAASEVETPGWSEPAPREVDGGAGGSSGRGAREKAPPEG